MDRLFTTFFLHILKVCRRQGAVLIKAFAFLMLPISCPYSKSLQCYDVTVEQPQKGWHRKVHDLESRHPDSVQVPLFSVDFGISHFTALHLTFSHLSNEPGCRSPRIAMTISKVHSGGRILPELVEIYLPGLI